MAHFTIQLFKSHPEHNRNFSNTYIVEASDLTEAISAATIIETFEQPLFDAATTLLYARVSTSAPGDTTFSTVVYNLAGTSGVVSTGLPLFNTLRVDVNVVGGGRPSRFHYRLLHESEIVGKLIDATLRGTVAAAFNDLIADLAANGTQLEQPDGGVFDVASSFQYVVQRSLHRRRRKVVGP